MELANQARPRPAARPPSMAPHGRFGATPAAAPAGVAPKRPWGAMLGGLAAGLGLAWLANSLGLGGAFGQVMMFALLALLVMLAVGWFMRSRRGSQAPGAADSP